MKTFFLFIAMLLSLGGNAQSIITGEYFIDVDPGFGSATAFSFAPATNGSFSFSVNTSLLSTGFHKLYIRTKDSDGKWSHTTRQDVEILPNQLLPNIVAGEYFTEIDPGFGNATAFSVVPMADGTFSFSSIAPLPTAFHKLYIRTKDGNGKWSQTVRRDIEVLPAATLPSIVAAEYFIDADPGFGNATAIPVTATANGTFPASLATSGLAKGYHKLYVRTKDDNGKWSLTTRKDIEILEAVAPFVITSGEYFFDTDPGQGNGTVFTFNPADTNVVKSFDLLIGCANVAITRQIFFRVKDNKGDWSSTASADFLPKDAATVTTVATGMWSSPATWSNGQVPTANTKVILNHNITVDVDAACYLLRTNCKTVTVSTGKKLMIAGN
jgi:hypothetical protein